MLPESLNVHLMAQRIAGGLCTAWIEHHKSQRQHPCLHRPYRCTGPYLAERYIVHDDPAWAAAAADIQAGASAAKVAALNGVRRLAEHSVSTSEHSAGAVHVSDAWQDATGVPAYRRTLGSRRLPATNSSSRRHGSESAATAAVKHRQRMRLPATSTPHQLAATASRQLTAAAATEQEEQAAQLWSQVPCLESRRHTTSVTSTVHTTAKTFEDLTPVKQWILF